MLKKVVGGHTCSNFKVGTCEEQFKEKDWRTVPGPRLSETLMDQGRQWRSEEETIRLGAPGTGNHTREFFCHRALPFPPHPTIGQLISQTGSEDSIEKEAKRGTRVRGPDL